VKDLRWPCFLDRGCLSLGWGNGLGDKPLGRLQHGQHLATVNGWVILQELIEGAPCSQCFEQASLVHLGEMVPEDGVRDRLVLSTIGLTNPYLFYPFTGSHHGPRSKAPEEVHEESRQA